MRLVRMNKRSRYRGLDCMYCNQLIVDDRVAVCSTLYVYPLENMPGEAFTFSFSVKDMVERKMGVSPSAQARKRAAFARITGDDEIVIRVAWHRLCLEKILANPKGPYDPAVVASMYDEYREQLLERFEERKPGSVRYPSESLPTVPDGERHGEEVPDVAP